MSKAKWHSTKYSGVRFRKHPTRKHGAGFDRYFAIRFQHQGERVEESLGWASEGWTLEEAFRKLCDLKKAAKSGDGHSRYNEEKAAAKEKRRREALEKERQKTLAQAVEMFLASAGKRVRPKTLRYYQDGLDRAMEAILGKDVPPLKEWHLSEIERRHLAQIIEDAAHKSVSMAVCIRSSLSALYTWLAQSPRELVLANIVREIPKPGRLAPRERSLSNEEVGHLWRELSKQEHIEEVIPRMIRFALLTGCRLSEAKDMDRSEVRGNWWEIPSARFKGKRTHRVFLTPTALELLGTSEKPFHSPVSPKEPGQQSKPLDPSSISRHLNRRGFFGVEKFSLHDLRRTVGSGLAGLGFSLEIVAAVLGHKLPGVTAAHYLKHSYDRERQAALEAWSRHVLCCSEGKSGADVIAITARR